MAEDRVNIIDALQGQQQQLKRLIAQKIWINDAPKATLSEIDAQLSELKRLLAQLQSDVQDQLKKASTIRGLAEMDPMKQRSSEDVSKALDLASQQIDNLSDQSATAEEQKERKNRLLKGPKEFRDIRDDFSEPKR
jgi:hypothetical protein